VFLNNKFLTSRETGKIGNCPMKVKQGRRLLSWRL